MASPVDDGPARPRPAVFLAASVPDGVKQYPGCERHRETAHPQWIRDAVLALARQAFEVEFDLVFGAHPSISPMLLTVAREFRVHTGGPRITVYRSEFFKKAFPPETLELTEPPHNLGRLVPFPDVGDREESLRHLRESMCRYPGLCAAVFVGGMDGLFDEGHIFKTQNPALPAYAIGSTGGASLDLLDRAHAPYLLNYQHPAEEFAGSPVAPIDRSELLTQCVGYTRVARAIITTLQEKLGSGDVTPRA